MAEKENELNAEQIAKLKALAQAAESEVIRSHGWAGSVEMLETLRIDEEYLTAASPAAILELIALAERTTSPVSQMTEHKGAAQIHRSNDKGASNQGHKPLPIAKDSLLVRKVHPAPVEGTFTRGEARAAVLAVAAAAPHAQAAAPVAEQKWPESEAFKYINQKVAEQMSPASKSAQPQPVAEQGELPPLPTYNELAEMAQGVTLAGSAAFMASLPEGFDGKLLQMAATPNGSIVVIQPDMPAHILEYGAKEFVPLWPTAAPPAPTDN